MSPGQHKLGYSSSTASKDVAAIGQHGRAALEGQQLLTPRHSEVDETLRYNIMKLYLEAHNSIPTESCQHSTQAQIVN